MPQGTARQLEVWSYHREICKSLGIGQSTLQHKALAGSLGAASPTGVKVYTPPDPTVAAPTTTDTAVWCVWEEKSQRPNTIDAPELGRVGPGTFQGQLPAVDDNGALVTVNHDDWIKDANSALYRILNPQLSPDLGYWTFEAVRQR